jgi:hypothetical protein
MNDIHQTESKPRPGDAPVPDLVASKLLRPLIRSGTVNRSPLIERLAHGDPHPVVSVVAPAGYGKTTLLSQWAEHSHHTFAWVSVDEGDNDPKVLLTYIAEALDAVEPISGRVFEALGLRRVRCWARSSRGWRRHSGRCPRRSRWCSMMCMYCAGSNAGPRCRCWPITYRPGRVSTA